jgi:transient receptor potential cation channel subfamily C protein 4
LNFFIKKKHDVRCSCHTCISARSEDSLKYSKSRVNAYKALASPSLISLSSKDPILTAFQLSWELKRLSKIENEFKFDYEKLSQQCQEYASALLAETRTSQELEIILNYDHENPPALFENEKEKTNLSRLKLAIKYKQKKFVAHPHCQQLLVSLWYDGISGYRRRNIVVKIIVITFITLIFPFLSILYMIMPRSRVGKILRQPFIKFICHSASYITFLFLLIMVSLRINSFLTGMDENDNKEKRGPPPTNVEWIILIYVTS